MTDPAEKKRSFTGDKLDWMTALMADDRLDPGAKVIGFCIAQAVNQESGCAFIGETTLSHKTGMSRSEISRGKRDLRAHGWVDWKRTRSANVYWTLSEAIQYVISRQRALKETRQVDRQARTLARTDASPLTHLKTQDASALTHRSPSKGPANRPDASTLTGRDVSTLTHRDASPVTGIHLQPNTFKLTPSLRGGTSEKASHDFQDDDLPL
jgi:hypothetical protein